MSSKSSATTAQSSLKMGPPAPVPLSEAKARILEPEMDALSNSLKRSTIVAGQIYKFYADAQRLQVHLFAPKPPRSLTSSLAIELARYDQICDALDTRLARAVATLQRDLNREEARIKEEEEREALEKAAKEKANQRAETPDVEMQPADTVFKKPVLTPTGSLYGAQGRRQSKISLSTLHRSQFPLKLDLSSAALRLSADEAGMGLTGLASPITLAPKSARPMAGNELPPDLLAALAASAAQNQGVDIDLTLPDSSHSMDIPGLESHVGSRRVSGDLGGTVDKPIELDIDLDGSMKELFGNVSGGQQQNDMEELFGPSDSNVQIESGGVEASSSNSMGDIFNALSSSDNQRTAEDLLATLGAQSAGGNVPGSSVAAPSPASLLASLTSSDQPGESLGLPQNMSENTQGQDQHFDYSAMNMSDITNTFGPYFESKGDDMMAMADLLGAGADAGTAQSGNSSQPAESSSNSQ